jgi:hypothetical protein
MSELRRVVVAPLGPQLGVDRNERGRERPFAEQVLRQVPDPKGGGDDVGHHRGAEEVGGDALAQQADQLAEQDPERHECCRARLASFTHGSLSLVLGRLGWCAHG